MAELSERASRGEKRRAGRCGEAEGRTDFGMQIGQRLSDCRHTTEFTGHPRMTQRRWRQRGCPRAALADAPEANCAQKSLPAAESTVFKQTKAWPRRSTSTTTPPAGGDTQQQQPAKGPGRTAAVPCVSRASSTPQRRQQQPGLFPPRSPWRWAEEGCGRSPGRICRRPAGRRTCPSRRRRPGCRAGRGSSRSAREIPRRSRCGLCGLPRGEGGRWLQG